MCQVHNYLIFITHQFIKYSSWCPPYRQFQTYSSQNHICMQEPQYQTVNLRYTKTAFTHIHHASLLEKEKSYMFKLTVKWTLVLPYSYATRNHFPSSQESASCWKCEHTWEFISCKNLLKFRSLSDIHTSHNTQSCDFLL